MRALFAVQQGLSRTRSGGVDRFPVRRFRSRFLLAGARPRSRVGPALAGALVLAGLAGEARGACEYEVTIIEGPSCGIFGLRSVTPTSINELGHVAGYHTCIGDDRAFVWTQQAGIITLPIPPGFATSRAYDISDAGDVVGQVTEPGPGLWRAVLWQDDEVIDLGIPPGGNFSEAHGINDDRVIAGTWGNNVSGPIGVFRWADGDMRVLSLPVGPSARAYAINEVGQITGWMGVIPFHGATAFIWDDEHVEDLGVVRGGVGSEARAISNNLLVAGVLYIEIGDPPGFVRHAFLWEDSVMSDLGTLPAHTESFARGVNGLGEVVGFCMGEPVTAPFLYGSVEGMRDVNELVQLESPIVFALAINGSGVIAAKDWEGRLVLLRPNRPRTDLNGDCRTNEHDLLLLLGDWGQELSPADIDGDGLVSFVDLLLLLQGWG